MHCVHGEASYHLATPELTLDVTARGGHMAPVVFHLPGRNVSPYALAPWLPGECAGLPPLLDVLRGDFLCLPFGTQGTAGPPHGEPANGRWAALAGDARTLELALDAADSGARVEKCLTTRAGQHAVFIEHRVSRLAGDFNYGTHPVLDLSGLAPRAGRITTSPFRWASVYPGCFSDPAAGESQALQPGAVFSGDLCHVALAAGGTTDLSHYPDRPGNDDLVMMVQVAATPQQPFAWSAAVLDGYVWFSLKNPADFPATLLWLSNGGRSAPPWNGRHLGRIGIEEVCSHFADGVEVSRQDLLAAHAIPTTRRFDPRQTVALRHIHAVALLPEGFGAVSHIVPCGEASVTLTGETGAQVRVALDWRFVA